MLYKTKVNTKKSGKVLTVFIFLILILVLAFILLGYILKNTDVRIVQSSNKKISPKAIYVMLKELKELSNHKDVNGVNVKEQLIEEKIKKFFSTKQSLKYTEKDFTPFSNLKIQSIQGDEWSRIISYKNSHKTFQFIQCYYNDRVILRTLINGDEKAYSHFYMDICKNGKNLICIGSNYEIKPRNAFVKVLSYNGFQFCADKSGLCSCEENISPWHINEFEGTIGLGNENYKDTDIILVKHSGKDIFIAPSNKCVSFMGYNPGILKLTITENGLVCTKLFNINIAKSNNCFITEQRAVSIVSAFKEVQNYQKTLQKVSRKSFVKATEAPYINNKYWEVCVGKDYGDHIVIYNVYYIDAKNGHLIKKLYNWS